MIQVVSAFIFALAVVSFSNGCKNLLGEDKNENKKKTVEMLRDLADMLEEQEDQLPYRQAYKDTPDTSQVQGYPSNRPRGHPPTFGINNNIDEVTKLTACTVWDKFGYCAQKAAAGVEIKAFNIPWLCEELRKC